MNEDLHAIQRLLSKPEPTRWVFAGDSITHGALHTMGWRDYTELFSERLRYEMDRRRDCMIKTACSGWRIGDLATDLEWTVLQHRPHVVSIALGMNDCGAGSAGRAEFQRAYVDVVKRIREATSAAVILHTPNRIHPSDPFCGASISEYACSVREVAANTQAILVDHYTEWEAAERDGVLAYWMSDAIHPNECGHRAMTRLLLQTLNMWDPKSRVARLFIP
jgi:acyl-CoA thioesterase I